MVGSFPSPSPHSLAGIKTEKYIDNFFNKALQLLQYSSTLPDSFYNLFDILSYTCHQGPYYLNSDKPVLTLSNQYINTYLGNKPGSSSECVLEFDTRSKPLGHQGQSEKHFCPGTTIFEGSFLIKISKKYTMLVKSYCKKLSFKNRSS